MAFHGSIKGFYLLIFLTSWLVSCSSLGVPETYVETNICPNIYPDYAGVTIPENIAPLNFMLPDHEHAPCVARVSCKGEEIVAGGKGKLCFDIDAWHALLKVATGDSLKVEVFLQSKQDGTWTKYQPFYFHVADSIDAYVSYRLIPPAYMMYEELHLSQRNLSSFEVTDIYNNLNDEGRSPDHCINCHAFQNYRTDRMQFHVREDHGGTVFYDEGAISKRDLKRFNTISAGVYPAWHPTLDMVAYSTNQTMQHFHTVNTAKVEVQDKASDLVLYDVKKDTMHVIADGAMTLEVFPAWNPDGSMLYYSVAQVGGMQNIVNNYDKVRYNICRRSFDATTLSFGPEELVYDAVSDSLSALLPRISPDGRWLLFSMAPYGVFHIWHHESDLYLADLQDSVRVHALDEANSDRSDSYHNWSSNSRWIVFTSRRVDGNYTRLYFSYIDAEGKAHKAFEMPQEDPEFELLHGYSYNVPEFTIEPVKTDIRKLRKLIWKNN